MIAHKIIDALRGKPRGLDVGVPKRLGPADIPAYRTWCTNTADEIAKAEKFEFTSCPLEPDVTGKRFSYPGITRDEQEAWHARMLPLPAPVCWCELPMGDSRCLGLLIAEAGDNWVVQQVIVGAGLVRVAEHRIRLVHDRALRPSDLSHSVHRFDGLVLPPEAAKVPEEDSGGLVLYLTLMIGSRSTAISSVTAPAKLNAARIKRGLTPLPDHRIVRIVPEEYIRASREEAGLGTRLPPRLHWRRSHIRHIAGDRKVLIPRCLVGRPELGTVSHEYRVAA
jgi:hypothetical protein